jgi:CBS domain-containing membrane protein
VSTWFRLKDILRRFLPQMPLAHPGEILRASIGGLLGIGLTGWISTAVTGDTAILPLLIAPIGASTVLLFAVPSSPLAQPWSIMGGNVTAAMIGVAAAHWIKSPLEAAAVAECLTLAATSVMRCVHPPAGAVALTAVLGGPHIAALGYEFALVPVGLNSLVLCTVALIYNNSTRRSYPHHAHKLAHPHPPASEPLLSDAELDDMLEDYGEMVDVSRDDLRALFREMVGRVQRARRNA